MALRHTVFRLGRQTNVVSRRHSSSMPGSGPGLFWLIPIGAVGYYGYNRITETIKDPWEKHKAISEGTLNPPRTAVKGEILFYKILPLRTMSRIWGHVNNLTLPVTLRRPLLGLYVKSFGCKMEEAVDEELRNYPNLGSLFRRSLKAETRPVDQSAPIVSPADGHVIHFGTVENGCLEQVKGVTYSLEGFLGNPNDDAQPDNNNNNQSSLLRNPEENSLYHCVIYLAPGDYHRYHSPADWTVEERKHFPGELFSVSPGVARWMKGLFNYNERVVYSGTWQHGFFCYAPVGATNVGSIKAYCDPTLETNVSTRRMKKKDQDSYHLAFPQPIPFRKGDPFGEFNLGSSIVLIFEAPKNFKFHLTAGQKIKFGNYLGRVEEVSSSTVAETIESETPVVESSPVDDDVDVKKVETEETVTLSEDLDSSVDDDDKIEDVPAVVNESEAAAVETLVEEVAENSVETVLDDSVEEVKNSVENVIDDSVEEVKNCEEQKTVSTLVDLVESVIQTTTETDASTTLPLEINCVNTPEVEMTPVEIDTIYDSRESIDAKIA